MWKIDLFTEELVRAGLSEWTIASYRLHVGRFVEWCMSNRIDSPKRVTESVVQQYLETEILKQPWTAGWKYTAAIALRKYFDALEKHGVILIAPPIPFRRPRVLSGHYRAVDRDSLRSILDTFPTDVDADVLAKTILEAAYSAALRPMEIRRLKIEDIDFTGRQLFLEQSKGKKDRIVPIGRTASFWLKRYITEVRPNYARNISERHVFLGMRTEKPFHHSALAEFIAYRLKRNGFPHISLHQLRASAATHLVESGADTAFVQRILGHAEIETTRTYVQIDHHALASKLAENHPRAAFG